MKLIATKAFRYATRKLKAGDEIDVPTMAHGKILKVRGLAKDAPPPKLRQEPAKPPEPDLDALRARYLKVSGEEADGRWGAGRLQDAIDQASRYTRRDMRAED